MPRQCGDCDTEVEPVAVEYSSKSRGGYFVACPMCHYVFSRIDDTWFSNRTY